MSTTVENLTPEQKQYVREWIAALRSGEYEQGGHCLCKETRYCCIGVAGKLFIHGFSPPIDDSDWYGGCEVIEPYHHLSNLLGYDATTQDKLVDMNDQLGKSFTEIADYLEKEVYGLEPAA